MSKVNFDQKRATALKAIQAARVKAIADKKKADAEALKIATAEQNIVSDAKTD